MITQIRKKPQREELPPDANLCEFCGGKCCRYFALPIDTPNDWDDYENIRWYVLHQHAGVFTEDGAWYLVVHTRCKNLTEDNLCADYENRPNICRSYTMGRCEYDDDWVYDHYFETPEQVYEYAEAILGPRHGDEIRSPRNSYGA